MTRFERAWLFGHLDKKRERLHSQCRPRCKDCPIPKGLLANIVRVQEAVDIDRRRVMVRNYINVVKLCSAFETFEGLMNAFSVRNGKTFI